MSTGLFYGYCTVIKVRTDRPLLLEFRTPNSGEPLRDPGRLVEEYEFVTWRYVNSYVRPPEYVLIHPSPRKKPGRKPVSVAGMAVLALTLLAWRRRPGRCGSCPYS